MELPRALPRCHLAVGAARRARPLLDLPCLRVPGCEPRGSMLSWPCGLCADQTGNSASTSVQWMWTPSDPLSCRRQKPSSSSAGREDASSGRLHCQSAAGPGSHGAGEGALDLSSAALHVTFCSSVGVRGPLAAPNSYLTNLAHSLKRFFFSSRKMREIPRWPLSSCPFHCGQGDRTFWPCSGQGMKTLFPKPQGEEVPPTCSSGSPGAGRPAAPSRENSPPSFLFFPSLPRGRKLLSSASKALEH